MKRCYSLKRNKDFRRAYRKGESKASRQLVLIYARSGQEGLRVGFSVSKKLGNSVVRNRVKRRLRASFHPLIPRVKTGYDIILIAREPVVNEDFTKLRSAVEAILRRAELLLPEPPKEEVTR